MIGTLVRIILIWGSLCLGIPSVLLIGQPERPAQIPHSGVDKVPTAGTLSAAVSTTTARRQHVR